MGAIEPHLKCTQFGKFKKEYEDKIALAEANIDSAVEARSKVQAVYDGLAGQKNELSLALKSGGSAVQDIIDKTCRIEGQAADVQGELAGVVNRIKGEKTQKVALEGQIGKTNATVSQLEGEVKTQEGVLATAEQDRADKDDQIRTLKHEIAHQGDMITKLGKEKRSVGDGRQKTEEDIQAAEDKCNHLSRVKGKLEEISSLLKRPFPILNVSRQNLAEVLLAKKRKGVLLVQRSTMRQLLHQNMPSRPRSCWLDLKNLMKSFALKEPTEPRLRKAAPC